jgi:hypothetical protein
MPGKAGEKDPSPPRRMWVVVMTQKFLSREGALGLWLRGNTSRRALPGRIPDYRFPRHYVPGYDRSVPPGQTPVADPVFQPVVGGLGFK